MKVVAQICLAFLLLISPVLTKAVETPLVTVQTAVNQVMDILNDRALEGEDGAAEKVKRIWGIVDGVFDYQKLSQQALGKNWRTITPEEREEFTRLFSRFLGQVYITKISTFSDNTVNFAGEVALSDTVSEVRTKVRTAQNEIPIAYRLTLKDGEWKVYDVIVEGVSLLNNYRSQFRDILAKRSMQSLLAQLREKV
jgi:phospholipid transport system substrate-binding protein